MSNDSSRPSAPRRPDNRVFWEAASDDYQARHGDHLRETALAWGVWRIPESELGVLGPLTGRDVLELGCGGGQWSLALRAGGARAVGVDLSRRQLTHAQARARAERCALPLAQGSSERLPFASARFDVVFCDHGAMSFAAPGPSVAEAARVLRPGGLFAFCMSTPFRDVCWDAAADRAGTSLALCYFELSAQEDAREGSVTQQLPYGAWIRLFRTHGLGVEDLIELRPPTDARCSYEGYAPLDWARRWPAEHIWKLRRA